MRSPRLRTSLPAVVCLLVGAACGGPIERSAGPSGVAALTGLVATGADAWAVTAPRAELRVTGRPSSVLYVVLRLTAPTCGAARVAVNGETHLIDHPTDVSTVVRLGASGASRVSMVSASPPCAVGAAGRSTYADITAPATAVLAPGAVPWVVPIAGFRRPELDAVGNSWWMNEPRGTLLLRGRPSTTVSVEMALTPPACGPAAVTVGNRSLDVSTAFWTNLRVPLDARGRAELPVVSTSTPCTAGGERNYVQLRFITTQVR